MTKATEAQKMQLAEAFVRLAREALRGKPTDLGAAEAFGTALFECPRDGFEGAIALLPTLCKPEELPDILRAVEDMAALDEGDA